MGREGAPQRPDKDLGDPTRFPGLADGSPALVRAQRVSDAAAAVGFDWSGVEPVVEKVKEELEEVVQAQAEGQSRRVEELGDLLFAVVNLARHLGVEAEPALDRATARFTERFRVAELLARHAGRSLADCDEAELDVLWERAKAELR